MLDIIAYTLEYEVYSTIVDMWNLFLRLASLGIESVALNWLTYFFTDRSTAVKINDSISKPIGLDIAIALHFSVFLEDQS